MAGGSLHDRLFGRAAQQPPLAPRQRWLIACHTAEVLRRDGETGGVPMERATENAREIMANYREIKEIMGEADWLERLGNEILDRTGGANRKSFLPVKKALKLWRGAGKKKGQKKKNSRTQTVTVRHNLDLNMLNLQKALGFLAELHKTEVQDCIQKTTKPPYWQITEPILGRVGLPTPSHRLLAPPHMDDMFQALELMTGSGAKVDRKWNLAHRLSVVVPMLKPVIGFGHAGSNRETREVSKKQERFLLFTVLAAAALFS